MYFDISPRIGILHADFSKAQDNLTLIKHYFHKDQVRSLFPKITQIRVENSRTLDFIDRQNSIARKEPNYMILYPNSPNVGIHVSVLLIDDLSNLENNVAEEKRREVEKKYASDTEKRPTLNESNIVNTSSEEKKFETDEFGTVNGSFILPKSGRNGYMQLSANIGGSRGIRVEEYKRPKFELEFSKLDKSYRIGDKVTVKGIAKAYAGNGISSAKVKYSIRRETNFPWLGWYRARPLSPPKQIAVGEVRSMPKVAETPKGVPTPALITRAIHQLKPFKTIEFLDLGLKQKPSLKHFKVYKFGILPSDRIDEGAGIKAKSVVNEAMVTGLNISFAPSMAAFLGSSPSSTFC
jgi:23S rRNA pseudoU1915 N3-methylase RlmH